MGTMDNMIPVEGHSGLFRDPSSGVIINTNESAAKASLSASERIKTQDQDIKDLKSDMKATKLFISMVLFWGVDKCRLTIGIPIQTSEILNTSF